MTPPITEEQLAELERVEREATPGPWRHKVYTWNVAEVVRLDHDGDEINITTWLGRDDAAFIAASREALPALIQEVRRLRDAVESYEAASLEQHLFGDP